MALLLKERLISEIQEEIQLLEHLESYENWNFVEDDVDTDTENNAILNLAVHDSRGFTNVEGYVN